MKQELSTPVFFSLCLYNRAQNAIFASSKKRAVFVFGAISFHIMVYLLVAGFFLLQTFTTIGKRILIQKESSGSGSVTVVRAESATGIRKEVNCIHFSHCGRYHKNKRGRTLPILSFLLTCTSSRRPARNTLHHTCKGVKSHLFNRPPPVL